MLDRLQELENAVSGLSADERKQFAAWFATQPDVRLAEPIQSMSSVMGGDACIRETRVAVWQLVSYKRQGLSDGEILAAFPVLNASDLVAAWDFNAANGERIEKERKRHEEAA